MIPLATTTLTVQRPGAHEPYEAPAAWVTVATAVRGHISGPGGVETAAGGEMTDVSLSFSCELADIAHTDRIVDDATGATYDVVWVEERHGLGLDRMTGALRRVVVGAT